MTGAGDIPARNDLVAGSATGSIYDLGYRGYDGPRLGRRHAIRALFAHSLRSAFGIGRGGRAKIAPFGLAAVVLVPAVVQVGVQAMTGSLAGGRLALVTPETYVTTSQVFLVLFIAAQAPELVNRDLRSHLLTLYFSRALARDDYAIAKYLAMATALALVLIIPQALLLVGMVFASVDVGAGLAKELPLVPPVILSTIGASAFFAGVGLAIAAFAPRRAFAAGAIVVLFLVLSGVVEAIVVRARLPSPARAVALLDPFALLDGFAAAVFGHASSYATVTRSNLPTAAFGVTLVGIAVISLAILVLRYRRIQA